MRTGPCLVALVLLAAACTPGPARPVPPVPLPPVRSGERLAPAAGPAQDLVPGEPVPARWWTAFRSDRLDQLVEQALRRNADIATAEATMRQARELARAAGGALGPQVDAGWQSQRARISGALSSPLSDASASLYSLHTAQLSVTYPLDVFGAGRSRLRSAKASAEVAAARLAAARTTVAANLVLAVIQHASLDGQLSAARDAVVANRELLGLANERRRLGELGETDVAAAQAALAAAEAQVPALERQVRHQQALIGTLAGIPAGAAVPELPRLADLTLPAQLPLSLPANTVRQRPDVRAAEAQVRGAAADLGTAVAARLPTLALTGAVGGASTEIGNLLASPNLFYTVTGAMTQPLFHSGQLLHQQRAAEAALAAAQAQYRGVAMQAFLDVDDALTGLRSDAAALDAAARQDVAARRTLALTRRQFELGAAGRYALLGISATAAQAAAQLIQAQAARMADAVALFQACGTGLGEPEE